ncbi:unnamed protein product [Linum tenue]|uniref:DUF674 domain-containing protein n=1 Tax=Linum tenue TaxID=586396 RepID=A0AAV0PAY1_9ROSI|nr:unnamed protein product [Linum tenue]
MSTPKVTLKLLINKKTKKVLFAEAGKDFVDFLFTLLSFPLGTVIKLLSKNKMVGSLGNLYHSIEELSDTFFQSKIGKGTVLNPKVPFRPSGSSTLLLSGGGEEGTGTTTRKIYMCHNYKHQHVTDNPQTLCPSCKAASTDKAVGVNSEEGGFVKGVITYMVMDNLEVKPMSTISSITMLNKFNVQEVGALEEKVIELGMDEVTLSVFPLALFMDPQISWILIREVGFRFCFFCLLFQGLNLLKASLQSQTVLTNVFLGA